MKENGEIILTRNKYMLVNAWIMLTIVVSSMTTIQCKNVFIIKQPSLFHGGLLGDIEPPSLHARKQHNPLCSCHFLAS
jgi:hypothetical protein